jgi:hypothetical protein
VGFVFRQDGNEAVLFPHGRGTFNGEHMGGLFMAYEKLVDWNKEYAGPELATR